MQASLEKSIQPYRSQLSRVQVIEQFDPIPTVMCEPEEIQQVWTHLILNAVQALKDQGTLTLTIRKENHEALVCISDTGCGMDEPTLHRLFEPFFTTRSSGEGSGLGMAIVKKIIDKHHGRINVSSNQDSGTTVFVYLPYSTS